MKGLSRILPAVCFAVGLVFSGSVQAQQARATDTRRNRFGQGNSDAEEG